MLHSNKIHVAINQILINAMIYFNMVAIPPPHYKGTCRPSPPHTLLLTPVNREQELECVDKTGS